MLASKGLLLIAEFNLLYVTMALCPRSGLPGGHWAPQTRDEEMGVNRRFRSPKGESKSRSANTRSRKGLLFRHLNDKSREED